MAFDNSPMLWALADDVVGEPAHLPALIDWLQDQDDPRGLLLYHAHETLETADNLGPPWPRQVAVTDYLQVYSFYHSQKAGTPTKVNWNPRGFFGRLACLSLVPRTPCWAYFLLRACLLAGEDKSLTSSFADMKHGIYRGILRNRPMTWLAVYEKVNAVASRFFGGAYEKELLQCGFRGIYHLVANYADILKAVRAVYDK